jgi:hypothetical protein
MWRASEPQRGPGQERNHTHAARVVKMREHACYPYKASIFPLKKNKASIRVRMIQLGRSEQASELAVADGARSLHRNFFLPGRVCSFCKTITYPSTHVAVAARWFPLLVALAWTAAAAHARDRILCGTATVRWRTGAERDM